MMCVGIWFRQSAHHVPGVGHEEVLGHVGRQQVEQDPLVVQFHLLHVSPLLLSLLRREGNRGQLRQQSQNTEFPVALSYVLLVALVIDLLLYLPGYR